MNDYVKKEWGLTALEESERRAIEGGWVEPTITNPGTEMDKTIIKVVTILWNV